MKIVIFGAGGHAYVLIDILKITAEHEIVGILDASHSGTDILGIPILGGDAMIDSLIQQGIEGAVVAIGSNTVRMKVYDQLVGRGLQMVNVIHPSATISPYATLGQGVVIMPQVAINVESRIGNNCIINTGATLDHHTQIGNHVHIAPGCHLAGNVHVGDGSFLGVGTTVIDKISIGSGVVVGAGTSVYRDVPSGKKIVGAPMRYLDESSH